MIFSSEKEDQIRKLAIKYGYNDPSSTPSSMDVLELSRNKQDEDEVKKLLNHLDPVAYDDNDCGNYLIYLRNLSQPRS